MLCFLTKADHIKQAIKMQVTARNEAALRWKYRCEPGHARRLSRMVGTGYSSPQPFRVGAFFNGFRCPKGITPQYSIRKVVVVVH